MLELSSRTIKLSQLDGPEVRNARFMVKITNPYLLGMAIRQAKGQNFTGSIGWQRGGFDVPSLDDYDATIFSSEGVIAQASDAEVPQKNYIYTMQNSPYETGFKDKKRKIAITGGWVKQGDEWVLIIFTPKWNPTKSEMNTETAFANDIPKLAGRQFYNNVYGRYVTKVIYDEVLKDRNFVPNEVGHTRLQEQWMADFEDTRDLRPDQAEQTIDDILKEDLDYASMNKADKAARRKEIEEEMGNSAKNFAYLYKGGGDQFSFSLPIPNVPPNEQPQINFNISSPRKIADISREGDRTTAIYEEQPAFVDLEFVNTPSDMPDSVYRDIRDFLVYGLKGEEFESTPNQDYGKYKYRDANPKESSFEEIQDKKISELERKIDNLIEENKGYGLSFESTKPSRNRAPGIRKGRTQYIVDLKATINRLTKNLPMELAALNKKIKDQGVATVTPQNVNLLKLIRMEG